MVNNKKLVTVVAIVIASIAVALLYGNMNGSGSNSTTAGNVTVGSLAPDYGFFLGNSSETNLSSYRGHPVLLWFVATWCSTCAQGNQALNSNYQFFRQHGVKIIELELYKDLGYSGPSINNFVYSYAPSAYSNGTVIPAYAGYNMTAEYDPKGYLDIYYLISSNGTVLYINGAPASTAGQLEQAVNAFA
jgi:thiol-disulfide isomerase/thioredoxin